VRAWLNSLPGFENAGVDAVDPLTDGFSNVHLSAFADERAVCFAVLRVQPKRGIFEPYDVVREATSAALPVRHKRASASSAALDLLGVPDSPSAGFAQEIDVVQDRSELSDATRTPCWSALCPFCVHLPLREPAA
jgi:hypothetical protein